MCENHSNSTKVYNLSQLGEPISFLECREQECEGYIIMDIGEPVTITSKTSSTFASSTTFTTYLIRIETNYPTFSNTFSAVRRRYSEFCWLRDQLLRNHSDELIPELPPKKFLNFMNFSPSFIRQRLEGLSCFLQRVLETPGFLSDPSLLFFLQSDLSIQEMKKRLNKIQIQNPSIPIRHGIFDEILQSIDILDEEELESGSIPSIISCDTSESSSSSSEESVEALPSIILSPKPKPTGEEQEVNNRFIRRLSTESNETTSSSSSEESRGDSGNFEECTSTDSSSSLDHNKKGGKLVQSQRGKGVSSRKKVPPKEGGLSQSQLVILNTGREAQSQRVING